VNTRCAWQSQDDDYHAYFATVKRSLSSVSHFESERESKHITDVNDNGDCFKKRMFQNNTKSKTSHMTGFVPC